MLPCSLSLVAIGASTQSRNDSQIKVKLKRIKVWSSRSIEIAVKAVKAAGGDDLNGAIQGKKGARQKGQRGNGGRIHSSGEDCLTR